MTLRVAKPRRFDGHGRSIPMLPPPLEISPADARRFARRALLLDAPLSDPGAALVHHGYMTVG